MDYLFKKVFNNLFLFKKIYSFVNCSDSVLEWRYRNLLKTKRYKQFEELFNFNFQFSKNNQTSIHEYWFYSTEINCKDLKEILKYKELGFDRFLEIFKSHLDLFEKLNSEKKSRNNNSNGIFKYVSKGGNIDILNYLLNYFDFNRDLTKPYSIKFPDEITGFINIKKDIKSINQTLDCGGSIEIFHLLNFKKEDIKKNFIYVLDLYLKLGYSNLYSLLLSSYLPNSNDDTIFLNIVQLCFKYTDFKFSKLVLNHFSIETIKSNRNSIIEQVSKMNHFIMKDDCYEMLKLFIDINGNENDNQQFPKCDELFEKVKPVFPNAIEKDECIYDFKYSKLNYKIKNNKSPQPPNGNKNKKKAIQQQQQQQKQQQQQQQQQKIEEEILELISFYPNSIGEYKFIFNNDKLKAHFRKTVNLCEFISHVTSKICNLNYTKYIFENLNLLMIHWDTVSLILLIALNSTFEITSWIINNKKECINLQYGQIRTNFVNGYFGNLKTLTFLEENSFKVTNLTLQISIEKGYIDIVKYILSKGIITRVHAMVIEKCILNDHFEVFNYIILNNHYNKADYYNYFYINDLVHQYKPKYLNILIENNLIQSINEYGQKCLNDLQLFKHYQLKNNQLIFKVEFINNSILKINNFKVFHHLISNVYGDHNCLTFDFKNELISTLFHNDIKKLNYLILNLPLNILIKNYFEIIIQISTTTTSTTTTTTNNNRITTNENKICILNQLINLLKSGNNNNISINSNSFYKTILFNLIVSKNNCSIIPQLILPQLTIKKYIFIKYLEKKKDKTVVSQFISNCSIFPKKEIEYLNSIGLDYLINFSIE
ncbi:hypothetical protein ACTA71_011520 [Dictyostelium dimigraforme]